MECFSEEFRKLKQKRQQEQNHLHRLRLRCVVFRRQAWSQWSPNSLATVTQSLAKVMAASDEMLPSVDATLLPGSG